MYHFTYMAPRSGVVLTTDDSCVDEQTSERAHGLNTVARHVDCKKLGVDESNGWRGKSNLVSIIIHHGIRWLVSLVTPNLAAASIANSGLSLPLPLSHSSTSFSCARSSFPPDPKVFGFLMSLASHANHMRVVSPKVLCCGTKLMQTLILIFYVNVFDMFATSIGIRLLSFADSNLSMRNLRMSVESLVWETWIPSWIHMKYERGCSKSSWIFGCGFWTTGNHNIWLLTDVISL